MSRPLVSCVMPTRNRRRFAAQAIWYFLRQEYPEKELIVVDDGDDRVTDLVPARDDRIRYVGVARATIGAKRNRGCELARGELIAHWDDDDWFAPRRLEAQVAELERSGADACGASELLHYRLGPGDAWRCRYGGRHRPAVAAGTLVYRRAAWAEQPFTDVNVGECHALLRKLGDRIHALPDPTFQVAVVHSANATGSNVGETYWEPCAFDEVAARLGLDLGFYRALRNGGAECPARRVLNARVTLCSQFCTWDGYGSMAEYLACGMARAGVRVDVEPLWVDATGLSREFTNLLAASRPEPDSPAVWFAPPMGAAERYAEASGVFVNTMWESDRLPPGWAAALNRARAAIVPTRFVARVCRREGVTVPIEVIPEGVDPAIYGPLERPERSVLTTLMVGPPVRRKHVREGIAAWKRAFEGDPEARLILKGKFGLRDLQLDDRRITLADETEPVRGIAHWYRRADVLMALGNEGFGLPLVEAMATGLPAIALETEGQADVCEDAGELVLSVPAERFETCDDTPWGRVGRRGVPSVPAVARRLRWVAEHRDEARELGRAASEWALRERDVWAKGPAVLDAMERHLPGRRTLRRRRTLWAPGGPGTESSEYAAALAAAAAGVRLVRRPPDAPALRLLHVHHEEGAVAEAELSRRVLEARALGLPVAVTQHAAAARTRAWERDADVLVLTRADAAEAVRARWPAKWVEYIPPGCPTWFPVRKRPGGRVIATAEPLAGDGDGERLAAIVRQHDDARVLLFGPSSEDRGDPSLTGIGRARVRRLDPRLTGRALAERLAAEADVVALWRGALETWPASAAARTALASGVPVATAGGGLGELTGAVHTADDLAGAVGALLDDEALALAVADRTRDFCNEHSWTRVGERHVELWNALESS